MCQWEENNEKETAKQNEQQILPISESRCFSASMPNKEPNEDAHLHFKTSSGLFVFAVADGLGSFSAAAEASKQAIEYVKQYVDSIIIPDSKSLLQLFQGINSYLCELAKGDEYKGRDSEKLLGTTLILGIEETDKVTFAYLGNGAIIHIRGTIAEYKDNDDPWFASNLLNPHSVPQKGGEPLYKFLTNNSDYHGQPSIITVEKDKIAGDAFIICTDGISSQDHFLLYKLEDIDLARTYLARTYTDDKLLDLYNLLKKIKNKEKPNLENVIDEFLNNNKGRFGDDATLAILLTDSFLSQNKV